MTQPVRSADDFLTEEGHRVQVLGSNLIRVTMKGPMSEASFFRVPRPSIPECKQTSEESA